MVDTWSETALISISALSGTDVKFGAMTETVDIDIGDKDFDVIATLNGGRLVKFNPQDVTTITLEAYPLQAGTPAMASASTGAGFFDLMNTIDTTQPLQVSVDHARNPYRIAIMWTDAINNVAPVTDATAAITAPANSALRVVAAGGYFTSVKPSFTDSLLKFTVKYKVAPFDSAASANVKIESVGGTATATLASLASYLSTQKW